MDQRLRPLFMLLLLFAALIWVASIVWAGAEAGVLPLELAPLSPMLTSAAIGIGTALATFLGAAFGIRAREHLEFRSMSIPARNRTAAAEFEWAQIAGAWLYVIGLFAAFVMWFLAGGPDEPTLLRDSAASLVGLAGGVVGVVMGARAP